MHTTRTLHSTEGAPVFIFCFLLTISNFPIDLTVPSLNKIWKSVPYIRIDPPFARPDVILIVLLPW